MVENIPGGGRTIRLHRRRIEHVAERPVGRLDGRPCSAMSADLGRRFSIDAKRFYLTGLSGGARVAHAGRARQEQHRRRHRVERRLSGQPAARRRCPFALFGTAGTEDFNYIEMRQLDRKLTSPHHLAVFSGGHTLPPDAVALEAIEWMELQAMKSGRRPRDDALIDRLFEKRQRLIASSAEPAGDRAPARSALVDDFRGLRDVSAETARAEDLSRQPEVKKALARERADDDAEVRLLNGHLRAGSGPATTSSAAPRA